MRMIYTSVYLSESGRTEFVIDPQAVQNVLTELEGRLITQEATMSQHHTEIDSLNRFLRFVKQHHPDVITGYNATNAAKDRLEIDNERG